MATVRYRIGALMAVTAMACSVGESAPEDPVAVDPQPQSVVLEPSSAETSSAPTTQAGAPSSQESIVSTTALPSKGCAPNGERVDFEADISVELHRIFDSNGLTIDAALYPRPDYAGNPWSQWGQGILAPTGRYYSAIGDHNGADGNSFIYEYDPTTNELVMVADILSNVDHSAGAWGFGKIHAQMSLGPCDEIFFATYWGSRRGLEYADGYEGDLLFHIDPHERTLVGHGLIMAELGFPTMASSPEHGVLYTIGVDPVTNRGTFFVLDARSEEILFSAQASPGYRDIAVDGHGIAYFSIAKGQYSLYDPSANEIITTIDAPGSFLRADATTAEGVIVGVSQNPETFFTIDSDQSLTQLGSASGYTTSVALGAGEEEFFYLPGAHGNAADNGAMLKAVNRHTGEERNVVALADIIENSLGVTIGGTYNLVSDPANNRLYLGANVDPDGTNDGFGEVALLVIGLP